MIRARISTLVLASGLLVGAGAAAQTVAALAPEVATSGEAKANASVSTQVNPASAPTLGLSGTQASVPPAGASGQAGFAAPSPTLATSALPGAGHLLQTIAALCLVLGLLAALAWGLKRYGPRPVGGAAALRVAGVLSLGGRERIVVVELEQQWIVVGVAPGHVNTLATLPRPDGVSSATLVAGSAPPARTFSDWLKQMIAQRNAS